MNYGKLHKITVKIRAHSSLYLQPSPRYSVLKLENEKSYFGEKFISAVKKQKDVTHKTQIFQEAQKTNT